MPPPYSASQLRMYRQCPHQHWLSYDNDSEPIPRTETPIMRLGKVAHEVFADYNTHLKKTAERTDLSFLESLVLDKKMSLPPELYPQLLELCKLYTDSHIYGFISPQFELKLAFNAKWKVTQWEAEDAYFRAVIDVVDFTDDETAVIEDFKTGHKLKQEAELRHDIQMTTYAAIVKTIKPKVERIILSWDYIRYGSNPQIEISGEAALSYRDEIDKNIKVIEQDDVHESRLSIENCLYCPVRRACTEYMTLHDHGTMRELKNDDDAKRAWLCVRATKDHIAQTTDTLQAYIQAGYELQLDGGKALGWRTKTSYGFDREKAQEILLAHGVAQELVASVMSLSTKAIKGLCKKHEIDIDEFHKEVGANKKMTLQFGEFNFDRAVAKEQLPKTESTLISEGSPKQEQTDE